MQAAVLQAERQDNIKSIRFPDYIPPPEPNDDLRQLAKALGGFSDSLGTLADTGIKFEKQREEDAKLHAESLAAQGLQYGAFGDYAELTRNLERAANDPNRSADDRERARLLLADLKARANRLEPHISSQARIIQVRQNAMSVGPAAAANPIVGQDEAGNSVYLRSLAPDDPRYLQWFQQQVYGDIPLTPAEFKATRNIVNQVQIQDMNRQAALKVKTDEARYTSEYIARFRALGREHFYSDADETSQVVHSRETRRKGVQALIDETYNLGLSFDTQKELRKQMWAAYRAGAQEFAPKGEDITDVFYDQDDNTGVFVGPELERQRADGTQNDALLWVNTQDANWRRDQQYDIDQNTIQDAKQQLETANLTLQTKYDRDFDDIKDRARDNETEGTRDSSAEDFETWAREVQAQNPDNPAVTEYIKAKRQEFNSALDNTYSYIDTVSQGKLNSMLVQITNGALTMPDATQQASNMLKNNEISRSTFNKFLEKLTKVEDPAFARANADYQTTKRDLEKQLEGSQLTATEKNAIRLQLVEMDKQFGELSSEYLGGNLDESKFVQQAGNLGLDPVSQRLLTGARTIHMGNAEFQQSVVTDPNTGLITDFQPEALNRELLRGKTRPLTKLKRMFANKTNLAFGYEPTRLLAAAFLGEQNPYSSTAQTLLKKLKAAKIDPNKFMANELRKARQLAVLYQQQDPSLAANVQNLDILIDTFERRSQAQAKEVSVMPTGSINRKIADAAIVATDFLSSLVSAPASAQTVEIPPLPPIAEQQSTAPAIRISPGSKQQAIVQSAKKFGIDPFSLSAAMSYETRCTFNPAERNSLGYVGLIQFGAWEQNKYGVNRQTSFEDQAAAAAQFLIDRGVNPGDGIDRVYAAIIIGNADGRLSDGSDGMNAKDAYGNSANSALPQLLPGGGHYKNAVRFLRGA